MIPRRERILVYVGLALAVAALVWSVVAALSGEDLVGRASVVDGDTVEIQGNRVRFDGIDARQSAQPCKRGSRTYACGQRAAFALDSFIKESLPTRCELTGDRSRERWIGTCFRADGEKHFGVDG